MLSLLFVVNCHQNCPDFCSQQYLNLHPPFPKFLFPKSFKDLTKQHLNQQKNPVCPPPKNHEVQRKKYLPKNTLFLFFWGMGCHWIFHAPFQVNVTNFIRLKRGSKNHCLTGSKCSQKKVAAPKKLLSTRSWVGIEFKQTCSILWCTTLVLVLVLLVFVCFVVVYYISFLSFGNIGLLLFLYISFWSFGNIYVPLFFKQLLKTDAGRLVGWLVGYFRLPTLSILVDVIF